MFGFVKVFAKRFVCVPVLLIWSECFRITDPLLFLALPSTALKTLQRLPEQHRKDVAAAAGAFDLPVQPSRDEPATSPHTGKIAVDVLVLVPLLTRLRVRMSLGRVPRAETQDPRVGRARLCHATLQDSHFGPHPIYTTIRNPFPSYHTGTPSVKW